MNKTPMVELEKLDADELLRLQRDELRRRLADYQANPDESVVTLADIRLELRLN